MSGSIVPVNVTLDLCNQLKEIEDSTDYEKVSSTIQKTQKVLSEMSENNVNNPHFDNALLLQLRLLQILEKKNWTGASNIQPILTDTLQRGEKHLPSTDPDEIENYQIFLQAHSPKT